MSSVWVTYNGNGLTYGTSGVGYDAQVPPPIPPYTIRLKYKQDTAPTKGDYSVLIDATENIWDVTYVSDNWANLFDEERGMIEVIGSNTSSVTNMNWTFSRCYFLTTVAQLDTSSVTQMFRMFYLCHSLTSVALFDTSNVTNMNSMFYDCNRLPTVPLFDTSNVTDMHRMFSECNQLRDVPLFDTSNVTDMSYTFLYCWNLHSVPLFNTSKVTNMDGTFIRCGLYSVPLFDTSSVTTMRSTFEENFDLATIPLFDIRNVTNMDRAFYSTYRVESGALALYQVASTKAIPVTSHTDTFYWCGKNTSTGAAELAQIPESWGGTMPD
jgi:surface protein